MRVLSMSALAVMFALQQPAPSPSFPPEPYPGQANHAQPPEGWHCLSTDAEGPAHQCACPGMKQDPMCPVMETPSDNELHRGKCATWCFRDHCFCTMSCEDM